MRCYSLGQGERVPVEPVDVRVRRSGRAAAGAAVGSGARVHVGRGEAAQIAPIKPTLKAPVTKRLQLK